MTKPKTPKWLSKLLFGVKDLIVVGNTHLHVCVCVRACVPERVSDREKKQLQSGVAAFYQPGLFTLLDGVCIPLSHLSVPFHQELPAPGDVPTPQ